jgi:predicted lipoprotein with Yx(FWY)xxD motif
MNSRRSLVLASAAVVALVTACSSSGGGSVATTSAAAPPAAAPASSSAPPASSVAAGGGAQTISLKSGHLIAPDGRSLYILTSDQPGHLACSGACLTNWPPVTGTGMPGTGVGDDFATIARGADTQVTYDKHPLYMFAGDSAAGDTKGNGIKAFGGTWELASAAKGQGSDDNGRSSAPPASSGGGYP